MSQESDPQPTPNIPPPSVVPPPVVPPPSAVAPPPAVTVQSLTPSGSGLTGAVPVAIPSARGHTGAVPVYAPIEHGLPEPAHVGPPPRRPNALVQYWRKVGGGSLALSLAIHGVLIAIFVAIVYTTTIEPKVDFLPGGGNKAGQEASQEVTHQVQQKKRTAMNKSTPIHKLTSHSDNATISLPDIPVDTVDVPDMAIPLGGAMSSGGFGSTGSGGGFGKGTGIGGQAGFTSLPPSMKTRCNTAERLAKLKESGGTPECELAVSKALAYLKSKQNPDGSWGTQYKGAMTGFTLLCYFGRCETPDSAFYGENVMKGLLYLLELSQKNDGMMADNLTSNGSVYEHGIATYALGEMYSLARLGNKQLPGMREAFEKGVEIIIKHQLPVGGWGYTGQGGYRDTGGGDLSVTGWQYQALKSAKLGNVPMPSLHTSIDKAVKYMEGLQTKDGGYGNANREQGYNQWALTGTAALGLQTLGHGKTASLNKAVKFADGFFHQEPPTWKDANLYSWYYYAQMFFQAGGPTWKFWNETALPEILKNQDKDGSWNNARAGAGGNKIYGTALCTLMLEVYYRYLRVGDREESSMFDR